jgi:hypothetical protein
VTSQTAGTRLRAREILETNDLADITAAGDVFRSGSMAGLAPVTVFPRRLKVRSRLEVLRVELFVTGLAGIGTHVLRSLHNGTRGRSATSSISRKGGQRGYQQDQHDHRCPAPKICSLFHLALLGPGSSNVRRRSLHFRAALRGRHNANT